MIVTEENQVEKVSKKKLMFLMLGKEIKSKNMMILVLMIRKKK
jgi:hypothetical protein